MKKCPFCAEPIQDEAIKCRYCAEWLQAKPEDQQAFERTVPSVNHLEASFRNHGAVDGGDKVEERDLAQGQEPGANDSLESISPSKVKPDDRIPFSILNKKQKTIVYGSAVLIVLMMLFPPYHFNASDITYDVGFHFIFSPPDRPTTVNVPFLLLEVLVTALVAGLLSFTFKSKK